MYNMGWTGPGFFDYAGDELALQHAVSRYHAFVLLQFIILILISSFITNLLSHGFISRHNLCTNSGYRSRMAYASTYF